MKTEDLYTGDDYAARNPTYHEEDAAWKAAHILRMVWKHGLTANRVCEVGCGAGGILAALQRDMPARTTFHGYDIAPQAIERCAAKANEHLSFRLGDFASIEAPPYDLLLCIDVLEHLEEPHRFLTATQARATHKVFHVPIELSACKVLLPGMLGRSTRKFGHIHFFTIDTALDLLRRAGYTVVDWTYTRPGIDCAKHPLARLGRWPLRLLCTLHDGFAARLLGGHAALILAT